MSVLLIDNRHATAAALAQKLESEGFVAVAVDRPHQALDVSSCLRFSVLICNLPRLEEETIEVMRQLSARDGTRGIAVTDSPLQPTELEKAQAAGFVYYLCWPAPSETLVKAIRALKQQGAAN